MNLGEDKTDNKSRPPFIKVEKLGCKSGRRYLLRDINWEVVSGEHWLVFGMNGSGKTTLLSIIAGFKQETEGQIELFGQTVNNQTIVETRKKIGFVSASFFSKIYGNESARTIVLSGLTGTFGLDGKVSLEAERKAYDLLRAFHLKDRADYPFFILDEPYTGLDICNRQFISDVIVGLSRRKELTIIYVTHYVEEIIPIFENALLLKNGMVFRQGKTKDLFTSEVFSKYLERNVELHGNLEKGYSLKLIGRSDLVHKII